MKVDAAAEFILQAPASRIVALAESIVNVFVCFWIMWKCQWENGAFFLSLNGIPNTEAIVERDMDALADTALRMWPIWYSTVSFADIGGDTLGRKAAHVKNPRND